MSTKMASGVQNGVQNLRFISDEEQDSGILRDNPLLGDINGHTMDGHTYEAILESAKYIQSRISTKPKIGIICGSGLGSLAEDLQDKTILKYEDIPNFPRSTVQGHAGQLVFGKMLNTNIVCMQGRFHYYEGYPLWKCAMPIRVMKLIGVKFLIATNAAGGINSAYTEGDVMLIKDHINLMGFAGNNPLQGPNDTRWGPRFPPMNKAYDADLIMAAKRIWREENLDGRLFEGVYTCLGGPNFETVAELRMLKMIGVDAVGMSTVHEVLTARHCDMTVLAFSLITNECIMDYHNLSTPKHEEVMDVGKSRKDTLVKFVAKIVEYISTHKLDEDFTYEEIEAAANAVLEKLPKPPELAVVCGKRTDAFADTFEDKIDIPYEEIPNFPPSDLSNCSTLTYGTLRQVPIICFRGRFYLHRGSSIDRIVLPVRMSKLLGAKLVVLIGSASGINETYALGDIMFIKDHINFVGLTNNQVATVDGRWGGVTRSNKYSDDYQKSVMEAVSDGYTSGKICEGVYASASSGKQQTVVESYMLKQMGADAVGTSIPYETLAAVECGLDVVAFVFITAIAPLSFQTELKEWTIPDDLPASAIGSIVNAVTQSMIEKGVINGEKPPEEPSPEQPEGDESGQPPAEPEGDESGQPPEQPEEEKPPVEGKEEPPTEEEKEPPTEEEKEPPTEEGKEPPIEEKKEPPAGEGTESGKKPKKPCECKDKKKPGEPSQPEKPPEPQQPDEEKKKKKSCECKKKVESGPSAGNVPSSAQPASKPPSTTATPGGGASASKVPSTATPGGGLSKVGSTATPTGGASAAKVGSSVAPAEGASAAKVGSSVAPAEGASAAKVASGVTPAAEASAAEVPSDVNPDEGA